MQLRQRHAQARVLHPHFHRQRFLRVIRQAHHARRQKAEQITQAIVQNHHRKNQRAAFNNPPFACAHHRRNNQHDRYHRYQRQNFHRRIGLFAEKLVQQHAQHNRQNHNLRDGNKHRTRVDLQPLISKHIKHRRREQRRKQRGHRSNRHAQRHIALRQISNHVRRRAPGARTHQNHAHRNIGRQVKRLGQRKSNARHNGKLRNHAHNHRLGLLPQNFKIVGRQGQPHAKHNNAQQISNQRQHPLKRIGRHKPDKRKQRRPQGKRFPYKLA